MNLTENFTLEELIASNKAKALKIDNTPSEAAKKNLALLARRILQPIREEYGHPIHVNSGYRCPKLNTAVGGAKTSQHMSGGAADLSCTATNQATLFKKILAMIQAGHIVVGQLIWEGGSKTEPRWVHVSLPREGKDNNQVLYIYSAKSK